MSSEKLKEEIAVLFHASLLGRTDIINKVLSNLRQEKLGTDDILSILSTPRAEDDLTPLHIAAEKGHPDACRALLHAGAFVSAKPSKGDHEGKTPYQIAINSSKIIFNVYLFEQIAFGNADNVAKLLDGGIAATIIDDTKQEDSALQWATSFVQVAAMKELISRGANINYQNSAGRTALHVACNPGNVEIIKLLLDHGADLSITDNQGKTPKDILNPPNIEIEELILNPPPATFSLIKHQQNDDVPVNSNGEMSSVEDSELPGDLPKVASVSSHDDLLGNEIKSSLSSNRHFHSILHSKPANYSEASNELPLFVLWPPPQRQKRFASPPLQLNSGSNLLICVASTDIDIFPLLSWSGLMDAFDRYGFQAQVKRTSPGAKIRLCISQNVCPGRDRYEIVIRSDFALITASDETSLLYAVQTFVQIIHLYSDVKFDDSTSTLHIPALSINDWCDVPNRAVSWSFRSTVRNATAGTRDVIEMLSRLRMNMIYLVIDSNAQLENSATATLGTEESVSTKVYSLDEVCRRQAIELVPTLVLTSIDERLPMDVLKNFSHEMIALVFVYDSIPRESLSEEQYIILCQAACAQILFEVQSAGFLAVTLSCSEWILCVTSIKTLAIHMGLHVIERSVDEMMPTSLFSRPLVSPSEYIKVLADYSSQVKESGASLAIAPAFADSDFLYPSILVKMCCFYYGGFVWNREAVLEILDISSKDKVFDQIEQCAEEVASPDLSTVLYGKLDSSGLNIEFTVPKNFGTLIREVLKFILFPSGDIESNPGGYGSHTANGAAAGTGTKVTLNSVPGKSKALGQKSSLANNVLPIVLDLMTGNLEHFFDSSLSSSGLPEGGINILFSMEKFLWPIITSNVALESFPLPSKTQAAHCLRFFKKILQVANWKLKIGSKSGFDLSRLILGTDSMESSSQTHKLEEFQFPLEFEEFFAVINLLAIVCKAVVLVHNIKEKAAKVGNSKVLTALKTVPSDVSYSRQSLGSLLKNVPQGMKSDLANSLLESIEHLSLVWRHRFEKMNLENMANQFKSSSLIGVTNLSVVDLWLIDSINTQKLDSKFIGNDLKSVWLKYSQATLLLQRNSSIPVASLFRCMIDQLIMPESVEQTIKQLFSQQ